MNIAKVAESEGKQTAQMVSPLNATHVDCRLFDSSTISRFGIGVRIVDDSSYCASFPIADSVQRFAGNATIRQVGEKISYEITIVGIEAKNVLYNCLGARQDSLRGAPLDVLLVVSSPLEVWWLWQNGCRNVVCPVVNGFTAALAMKTASLLHNKGRAVVLTGSSPEAKAFTIEACVSIALFQPTRRLVCPHEELTMCDRSTLRDLISQL